MKHANDSALDALEDFLQRVRKHAELTERKRGIFYRGSTAFLHFHEDADGLFADVKVDSEFQRHRVSTAAERRKVLSTILTELKKV